MQSVVHRGYKSVAEQQNTVFAAPTSVLSCGMHRTADLSKNNDKILIILCFIFRKNLFYLTYLPNFPNLSRWKPENQKRTAQLTKKGNRASYLIYFHSKKLPLAFSCNNSSCNNVLYVLPSAGASANTFSTTSLTTLTTSFASLKYY